MDRTQQVNEIRERLKPYLKQYLETRGVKITNTGHFKCINPTHKDTDPSSHLVPGSNDQYFVCFGCGARGDVLTAAHWLEGLPLYGPEFLTENMQVLAQRFSIPFQPIELSEQEIYMIHLRQLYHHAADTLAEFVENDRLTSARGWSKQLCFDMRVGTVRSWQEFRSRLMAKGDYTVKFIEDNGIYESLFNPFVITFTLFDEFGHPVGFAARDSRWEKGSPNIKKFRMTEARIQLFNKREILYGFHLVRNRAVEITIVEGYADVLTAIQKGIEGFVGLLTTDLTNEQAEILQKYGKNDLALSLDFDAKSHTGQDKTEKTIDDVLSGKRALRIKIVDLSLAGKGEDMDPDDFLRKQADARTAWAALPKLDAFDWRLNRMRGDPPEMVAEKMVRLILNEPSCARMEVLLKKLSDFTNIRVEALQADLDTFLYEADRKRRDDAKAIQEELTRKLRYADPIQTDSLLFEAAGRIRALKRDTKAITVNTSLAMAEAVRDKAMARGAGLPGLRTGWDRYDELMGGLSKEDCYMIVGGYPSVGKTSWFCNLGYSIATLNEDVCVLYFSIDDAIGHVYPKFVALETGLPITWVAQPRRWIADQATMDKLAAGWNRVLHLVATGRLEIRDATFGSSVDYLVNWVDSKKKEFKSRHVLAFLDNLHKVREAGEGLRERFRNASENLKALSQSGRCSIAATAELVKSPDRRHPSLNDLSETIQIEHDATIAALFVNEMQADRETELFWVDDKAPPEFARKPIVEVNVAKNKSLDGAFKGSLWFEFDPARSLFRERKDRPQSVTQEAAPVRSLPPSAMVQGDLLRP